MKYRAHTESRRMIPRELVIVICLVVALAHTSQCDQISLDHVDGLYSANKVKTGVPITFYLRLTNDGGWHGGITNGFRVYSTDDAWWGSTTGDWTGTLGPAQFDGGFFVREFSINGLDADTIGFGAFRMTGTGLPADFNEVAYTLEIGPIDESDVGRHICLDSSYYPPTGVWKWAGPDSYPDWDGPHCYEIYNPNYDLSVESIEVSEEFPDPDQTLAITVTVKNNGFDVLPANTEDLKIWLDELLFCTAGSALGPDYTFAIPINLGHDDTWVKEIYVDIDPGDRLNISAMVNADSSLDETTYANNCAGSFPVRVDWEVLGYIAYSYWEQTDSIDYLEDIEVRIYTDGSAVADTTVSTSLFYTNNGFRAFVDFATTSVRAVAYLTNAEVEVDIMPTFYVAADSTLEISNPELWNAVIINAGDNYPNEMSDTLFTSGCNAVRAYYEHRNFMLTNGNGWEFDYDVLVHINTDQQYYGAGMDPQTLELTFKRYYGHPNAAAKSDERYMQHELAHVVYFRAQPDIARVGGHHNPCTMAPAEMAMSEGWANMVAGLVPDEDAWAIWEPEGPSCSGNLESNHWYDHYAQYPYQTEGPVSSFLWDLVDHGTTPGWDDDPFTIPFSDVFARFVSIDQDPGYRLAIDDFAGRLTWDPSVIDPSMYDDYCILLDQHHIVPRLMDFSCGDPTNITWTESQLDELPNEFEVSQNYPNPFNSNTQLRLQIPVQGDVRIAVFNLLGQQVVESELVDVTAGVHLVTIEMPNAASGVYFVTASQNNQRQTIKMLYLK